MPGRVAQESVTRASIGAPGAFPFAGSTLADGAEDGNVGLMLETSAQPDREAQAHRPCAAPYLSGIAM